MPRQLTDRLAEIDAARFVGRRDELALIEALIEGRRPERVVTIHGPGGIGKSTLLRAGTRLARSRRFEVRWVDGRDLPPRPEALEDALAGLRASERTVLAIDGYERIAALGSYLRRVLLSDLSERSLVIIAGRRPPEDAWRTDGWESLAVELRLGPLPDAEALELLRRHGVDDPDASREIAAWASGSPLALAVAAETGCDEHSPDPGSGAAWRPDERPEVIEALLRRLTGGGLDGPHVLTLATAALARVTTRELLADTIVGCDSEGEYDWLATRSFSEPLGEGIGLHDLVRRAGRAELHRHHPELERTLSARIADHLHRRALAEARLDLSIDLAGLARSGAIRWGYSWDAASRYWIDDVRPGDADEIVHRIAGTRHEPSWRGSERFVLEAPEHVAVVRDASNRLAGYTVALAPGTAPAFCDTDVVLGPRLAHARDRGRSETAVLWRDSVDLTGQPGSGVIGLLGIAGIMRSTHENPRFAYLPINPALPQAKAFAAALGAEHMPELDVELGSERIECHVVDYGSGGLLAAQRELVYNELGLSPPARPAPGEVGVDVVRQALRDFNAPYDLARSPLARGDAAAERAASVRARIETGVDRSFASSARERLLREVLVRGYIHPAASHELAAEELNLSRSTYFRHLKVATERLADALVETPPEPHRGTALTRA